MRFHRGEKVIVRFKNGDGSFEMRSATYLASFLDMKDQLRYIVQNHIGMIITGKENVLKVPPSLVTERLDATGNKKIVEI